MRFDEFGKRFNRVVVVVDELYDASGLPGWGKDVCQRSHVFTRKHLAEGSEEFNFCGIDDCFDGGDPVAISVVIHHVVTVPIIALVVVNIPAIQDCMAPRELFVKRNTVVVATSLRTVIEPKCGACKCYKCPIPGSKFSFIKQQEHDIINNNLFRIGDQKRWFTALPW